MNFFEHQDRARRQTKWLVLLFIVAVIAIVVAIDIVVMIVLGSTGGGSGANLVATVTENTGLLATASIATPAVIGIASLTRTLSLKMGGGGKVARDLGGSLVEADTRDPLRRRLHNVVEEIAIAAGVPVPEVYVLDHEDGINAFAAGYTPTDAAIAVTRGTLEKLDRAELQGVIAHEFAHVFNGDMRLNIRLIGILFGILMLGVAGRKVLSGMRFSGSSRSRGNGGAPILIIALALLIIGYLGVFFGRLIKAAVSRQRELLADASAVQFTRHPEGIAGALKKIAVSAEGSALNVDTEEVGHMLFGQGKVSRMMATHPPIMDRIQRIDPSFTADDLDQVRARLAREEKKRLDLEKAKTEAEKAREDQKEGFGGGMGRVLNPAEMIRDIGNPELFQMLAAAALAASIPNDVRSAARSVEWAPEVLFLALLNDEPEIREKQLLAVAEAMGEDSEAQLRALANQMQTIDPEQRLPLFELAFPALKRRPPAFLQKFLGTVDQLIHADNRIDPFEYLIARVVRLHLWEAANPGRVKVAGRKKLSAVETEARQLIAMLARHGHEDEAGAVRAWQIGLATLEFDSHTEMPSIQNWPDTLDKALQTLDQLNPRSKQKLVEAMMRTVGADEQVETSEAEILRAACGLLHVPLPLKS